MSSKIALVSALIIFLSLPGQAQDYSWQLRRSGQCSTVGVNPRNPHTVLAIFDGSLLVSYDVGLRWSYLGSPGGSWFGAPLLVHPEDTLTVLTSNSIVLKRSSDYGRTWTIVLTASSLVEAVVVDPVLPKQLYAAAFNGDIYRSTDRGITWEVISNVGSSVCDLAIRPDSTNILYVGTQGSGGGEHGKILKSTDAGLTWRITTTTTEDQVSHIAIDFFNPSVAYATTTGGTQQGVWKTTDWGEHWGPGNINYHGWYVDADRSSPAIIYIVDDIGSPPLRSKNEGMSWDTLSQGLSSGVSASSIKTHPLSADIVWLGAWYPPGKEGIYCWAPVVTGVRGDEGSGLQVTTYSLSQNYPNPFNPTTRIKYELPTDSRVSLKVYDLVGREVLSLVEGEETAGHHQVMLDSSNLSSGVYFYRLRAGNFTETKHLLLLR